MAKLILVGVALGLGGVAPGCAVGQYLAERAADFADCFRVEVGAGLGIGAGARLGGVADVGLAVAVTPRAAAVGWRYGEGWAFGLGSNATLWDAEIDVSGPFCVLPPVAAGAALVIMISGPFTESIRHSSAPARSPLGSVYLTTDATGRQAEPDRRTPPAQSAGFAAHYVIEGARSPTLNPNDATEINYAYAPAAIAWIRTPGAGQRWFRRWDDPWRYSPERRPLYALKRARVHAFDIEAAAYAGIVYARVGFSPGEFVDFVAGWFGADPARDNRFERPVER